MSARLYSYLWLALTTLSSCQLFLPPPCLELRGDLLPSLATGRKRLFLGGKEEGRPAHFFQRVPSGRRRPGHHGD